ncbi:hypothetical protein [Actinoplanes sp. NPDC048796]|uniref:hypothetical protein n=1 Tax=Actinoplanes sp. NPDC048796 TaxID=3155640 RepID=UPI0033FE7CD3
MLPRVRDMVVSTTRAGEAPARRDADGFEAFYRANVDRFYRALAVTLRRDGLAHEAVDEAMARAYAKWSVVGELESPAGWVFRVGFNWATSWRRKLRRERPPVADDAHPQQGPPDGDAVDLAEATDTTAYLWRDTGYVAHDLATGRESLLLPMTGVFDGSTDAADGISTAVAFDRTEEPCHPQVVHLNGTSYRQLWSAGVPGCLRVTDLRLNRDGDRLAIGYRSADGLRVALLDTEDGRLLTDRRVGALPAGNARMHVELAWTEDQTVRGVVVPGGGGPHDLEPFTVR